MLFKVWELTFEIGVGMIPTGFAKVNSHFAGGVGKGISHGKVAIPISMVWEMV